MNSKLYWFNNLSLEQQLFKTIEANHLLKGDTVDNHPDRLSDKDKIVIYDYNFDHTSIVRSNILEDQGYVPYCDCPRLVRIKSNGVGKQMSCDKCGTKTKFSQEFLNEWIRVHEANIKRIKSINWEEPQECPKCSTSFFTGRCKGCNYTDIHILNFKRNG